ncbi:uncharacterized protein IAS62_002678 [Cryptococcus decagattii]|uniref:Uncharacterized protein n=1 Tax=Cryptococcus decagattii TaxID=1859122 RepID=A0ABZ2AS76_9TREE
MAEKFRWMELKLWWCIAIDYGSITTSFLSVPIQQIIKFSHFGTQLAPIRSGAFLCPTSTFNRKTFITL